MYKFPLDWILSLPSSVTIHLYNGVEKDSKVGNMVNL